MPIGGQRPFLGWFNSKSPASLSAGLHTHCERQYWKKEFQLTLLLERPKWHLTKVKKYSPSQVYWLSTHCLLFARKLSFGFLLLEWWMFLLAKPVFWTIAECTGLGPCLPRTLWFYRVLSIQWRGWELVQPTGLIWLSLLQVYAPHSQWQPTHAGQSPTMTHLKLVTDMHKHHSLVL